MPRFQDGVNGPVARRPLAAPAFDGYLITEVGPGHQPLAPALAEVSRQLDVLLAQAGEIP